MEDNLYPRSSEYYIPNTEMDKQREEAEKADKAAAARDLNKMQQVLDRWNERIEFYKSTDAIPEDVIADKEKLATYMLAHKRVVEILREERSVIESIIDSAASTE